MIRARLNIDMKDDAPDYPALMVVDHILGGGALSSRLGDRLRVKDGVSYSVGSWLRVDETDNAGSWEISATAAPQNLSKAETGIREELARAFKDGFTAEEVKAAIASLLEERSQDRAQDWMVASRWSKLLELNKKFTDREQKLDDDIAAVSLESANAALRKYIDPAKLTVAIAADPAKRK